MKACSLLLLLLAGCATQSGDMNGARASWQGATYDEAIARWGTPKHHTVLSDGGYVYTWESETTVARGRLYPSIGIFGGSGGGVGVGTGVTVGPGSPEVVRCNRTLVFRNARVAEQLWQGDPGFCDSFRR